MSECTRTKDCAENEMCVSDGYDKKCVSKTTPPPKNDTGVGTLPTLAPKDTPDVMKTSDWKKASEEIMVLSKNKKKSLLKGRGFITDLVIAIIEFVVMILRFVLSIYKFIWQAIFNIVSSIFFLNNKKGRLGVLGWGKRYRCGKKERIHVLKQGSKVLVDKDKEKKTAIVLSFNLKEKTIEVIYPDGKIENVSRNKVKPQDITEGKCDCHPNNCKAYSLSRDKVIRIFTYLFPPYGIFLKKGLSGTGQIILASILTVLLYFPGLIYALSVVDGGASCNNSVTVFADTNFTGKSQTLKYGDYNMYDLELNRMNPCLKTVFTKTSGNNAADLTGHFKKPEKINNKTGAAFINSLSVSSKVNVELYSSNDFTGLIDRIEMDKADISKLKKIKKESCTGSKNDFTKIKAISIVPKIPEKLEKVGDYEVIIYEFIKYRGSSKKLNLEELEIILKTDKGKTYYDTDSLLDFVNNISSLRVGSKVKVDLISASFMKPEEGYSGLYSTGGSDFIPSAVFEKNKEKNFDKWINNKKLSGFKMTNITEDVPNLYKFRGVNFALKTVSILIKKKN